MLRFDFQFRAFLFASFLLYFGSIHQATAQYYLLGTEPAKVKWNQIKTPHFRVIYPRIMETEGQYVSNGLEYVYVPDGKSLFPSTPKTAIILHNWTTVPSSATYIAPRRMEFFSAPPQDIYPQDWIDQLIIHEFRHDVQYSAVDVGFTRGIHYVLGEQGVLGMFGLFLPMWFIEGDATVMETALHYTGRGRTPGFEMKLRAQFIDKGINPYEKANYGSYVDFVPGKYELGYQLVGWSRVKFGAGLWSHVLNNVGRRPYTLTPFSSEIKRQTGLNKFALYDTITHELQRKWRDEDYQKQKNNSRILTNPEQKFYTSYHLPVYTNDSTIVAVKSSIDDLTKVVLLFPNGTEKELFKVGVNFYTESLSACDSLIYWSELVNDPRWGMRDYRVIKTYNLNSGKIRQLTHQTRYYAPAVSSDGKQIAAVEISPDNHYALVILNAEDGSLQKKISTPENLLFIHPRWSVDAKSIVSVVVGYNGNSLAVTNPEIAETEVLLPFSYMELKRPSFFRNFILYNASYNGKDNIFAFDRNTKSVYRVTSARFGDSDLSVKPDSSGFIYSDYTADGYRLVFQEADPSKWEKITVPAVSAFPLAEKLTAQENFIFNRDSVPKVNYKSRPYRKLSHLFNFHSWAPLGIDMENFSALPGVTLISQNNLSTTVSTLGYQYNRNERSGKYFFTVSNESLYPAVDFKMDYGRRQDFVMYTSNDSVQEKWNEFNVFAGLRLPLKWTHNVWTRSFQPAASLNYKSLKMDESVNLTFNHDRIVTTNYSLLAANEMKSSPRDMGPRWAQYVQLNYSNTPFNNQSNSIFAGQATLSFPGIGRHHVFGLYGAYQKKKEEFYSFSDLIILPRGYSEIDRKELFSFSATYALPLFYPEWRIGHLMYFKRFKTMLFYDYARSSDILLPRSFSSVGFDLTSDFSLFSLIAPLDAGLRTIYHPEDGTMNFEFVFALNFGGMY